MQQVRLKFCWVMTTQVEQTWTAGGSTWTPGQVLQGPEDEDRDGFDPEVLNESGGAAQRLVGGGSEEVEGGRG